MKLRIQNNSVNNYCASLLMVAVSFDNLVRSQFHCVQTTYRNKVYKRKILMFAAYILAFVLPKKELPILLSFLHFSFWFSPVPISGNLNATKSEHANPNSVVWYVEYFPTLIVNRDTYFRFFSFRFFSLNSCVNK